MTIPQSASHTQTTFQFKQRERPAFNNRWASETIASSGSSSATTNSPPRSPEVLHEMDEEDEPPRSGEAKSPAYPQGPSLIFEPNIYLYSEPDAELASEFDLIINVAREVLNPFKAAASQGASANTPVPDTACTESSFKTAFEDAVFSPISRSETPKPRKEPEYVHMPWDHNTPILADLPALVELISERSNQGKKVLVHCQCGVSRSATLLIAYSMFKNPEKSMQDAYSAVKAKSRWIGPNMSLIYQLTDWKKMISNEGPKVAAGFGARRGPQTAGLKGPGNIRLLGRGGGMEDDTAFPEPQTAPLPHTRTSPLMSPAELRPESQRPQVVRTRSEMGGFNSGPSSAPPGIGSVPGSSTSSQNRQSWPDGDAKLYCPPSVEPSPQLQPSPQTQQHMTWPTLSEYEPPEPTRMPPPPPPQASQPRANGSSSSYSLEKSNFRMPGQFDTDMDNTAPPTPQLASPRNSGFYATVPNRRMSPWAGFFPDPRSPTERSGATTPVIRNIFDVL